MDWGRDTPKRLYKAQKRLYKHINVRQNLKILDEYPKYLTRVATNINLTSNIKYPILKTTYINQKGISINKRVLIRAL